MLCPGGWVGTWPFGFQKLRAKELGPKDSTDFLQDLRLLFREPSVTSRRPGHPPSAELPAAFESKRPSRIAKKLRNTQ